MANVARVKNAAASDNGSDDAGADEAPEQMADLRVDQMVVEFADIVDGKIRADNQGRIMVAMTGVIEFVVHEGKDEDGHTIYTSDLFKNTQDELQGALLLSTQNAAKLLFKRRYEALYPPEPKERKARINYKAEVDLLERQMAVMEQAINDFDRAPTAEEWAAAGVPPYKKSA